MTPNISRPRIPDSIVKELCRRAPSPLFFTGAGAPSLIPALGGAFIFPLDQPSRGAERRSAHPVFPFRTPCEARAPLGAPPRLFCPWRRTSGSGLLGRSSRPLSGGSFRRPSLPASYSHFAGTPEALAGRLARASRARGQRPPPAGAAPPAPSFPGADPEWSACLISGSARLRWLHLRNVSRRRPSKSQAGRRMHKHCGGNVDYIPTATVAPPSAHLTLRPPQRLPMARDDELLSALPPKADKCCGDAIVR